MRILHPLFHHSSRPSFRWGALALLLVGGAAQAGYPDDVILSGLDTWNGSSVGKANRTAAYEQVIKELAVTIANKPMSPAETLGVSGFDVAFTSTLGFIDARGGDDANPTPWDRVQDDGSDPTGVLWIPTLTARKGLPLSLEVGGNLGYVAFSRQAVFGAWGRWGIIEGYRKYPDLSVQMGYSGYVGNDELELGVTDMSVTLGYTLPFGTLVGINDAQFSPYGGVGMLNIRATPRMSASQMDDLTIFPVSGSKNSDNYREGYAPLDLHLGFRIRSGDFQVLAAGTLAPKVLPTVNMGFGFLY